MDSHYLEKEGSDLSSLFQKIILDLKNCAPLWEDFACKATKLHTGLRTVLQAISAYLEAFQKIADAATCARGSTKDIGSALTRICLRHRAVEARVKTFTNAIMDSLVIPLQEKLEDWKKGVINLEKEHLKEFKRGRSDLKKYSTDTLRIQRKAKKGNNNELQGRVESCLQDVTECKLSLAEVERRAVRAAMTEERARFCQFYELLEPVVQQEMAVLGELSHLQDATDQLRRLTLNPRDLPPSSEQVVVDTKFRSSPSSPQSLGSRKGSACSISSLNSNSSSSGLSPGLSPGQNLWQRNSPQATNINHGDSGSAALVTKSESSSSRSHVETVSERPHTISAAYERGHQRPHLTIYTFHDTNQSLSQPTSPSNTSVAHNAPNKPLLPIRCSSLERPKLPNKDVSRNTSNTDKQRPSPLPVHLVKEIGQPMYVNMYDIATLTANKAQQAEASSDSSAESSSGYSSQPAASPQVRSTTSIFDSEQEAFLQHNTPSRRFTSCLKPLPPVRRTSSISMSGQQFTKVLISNTEVSDIDSVGNTTNNNTASKSSYFTSCLEQPISPSVPVGAVAGTIKALTESRHTPANPGVIRRASPAIISKLSALTSDNILQKHVNESCIIKNLSKDKNDSPSFSSASNSFSNCSSNESGTQINSKSDQHNFVSEKFDDIYSTPKVLSTFSSGMHSHKADIYSNITQRHPRNCEIRNNAEDSSSRLINELTAKFTPPSSPITFRHELQGQDSEIVKTHKSDKMPPVLQRGGHGFIKQLNTKLSQQQIANVASRANIVQKIINNIVQPDPTTCHDSLMEQIKRGAKLKHNRTTNDRSAPKIH